MNWGQNDPTYVLRPAGLSFGLCKIPTQRAAAYEHLQGRDPQGNDLGSRYRIRGQGARGPYLANHAEKGHEPKFALGGLGSVEKHNHPSFDGAKDDIVHEYREDRHGARRLAR